MKKAINLVKRCSLQKEFIVENWLSTGYVSCLNGGSCRSFLLQQLMTAAATGKPWLGLDVKQAKAYGIFFESDKLKLVHCQSAIDHFYQVDESVFESQIRMLARVGEDNVLMNFDDQGVGKLTPFFHEIFEDIKSFQPKLVALDGALDLFCRNKSDPSHLEQFMRDCCSYIAETLNCAVLLGKYDDEDMKICKGRVWSLSEVKKVDDERILHCGKTSYVLHYQNGAFVV